MLPAATEVYEDVRGRPARGLLFPLRVRATSMVEAQGRDKTISIFTQVAAQLRMDGDGEREDAVLEILDFLYGWCAPSARI